MIPHSYSNWSRVSESENPAVRGEAQELVGPVVSEAVFSTTVEERPQSTVSPVFLRHLVTGNGADTQTRNDGLSHNRNIAPSATSSRHTHDQHYGTSHSMDPAAWWVVSEEVLVVLVFSPVYRL